MWFTGPSNRSVRPGAGPGPDGLRGDLLKDLLGGEHAEPIGLLFRDLVQLMADGDAPSYFCPWLGGGRLLVLVRLTEMVRSSRWRMMLARSLWDRVGRSWYLNALSLWIVRRFERAWATNNSPLPEMGTDIMVHASRRLKSLVPICGLAAERLS